MSVVPAGNGLVLVIVGATPAVTTVSEKVSGPLDPAKLVAVIARLLAAPVLGIPLSNPLEERLAHAGSPVPVQVIGAVPVAVN